MTQETSRTLRNSGLLLLLGMTLVSGVFAGFFTSEAMNSSERADVRIEERSTCASRIEGMQKLSKQQTDDMADMKRLMQTTNDLAAYTLRFLGDRARLSDKRDAAMLHQTQAAAEAAGQAVQAIKPLEQKVTVAAAKADEAASTAKAVDKKLDHAVQPALPSQPWIGRMK